MADDYEGLVEVGIDPISIAALTPGRGRSVRPSDQHAREREQPACRSRFQEPPLDGCHHRRRWRGERFSQSRWQAAFEVLGKPVLTWSARGV